VSSHSNPSPNPGPNPSFHLSCAKRAVPHDCSGLKDAYFDPRNFVQINLSQTTPAEIATSHFSLSGLANVLAESGLKIDLSLLIDVYKTLRLGSRLSEESFNTQRYLGSILTVKHIQTFTHGGYLLDEDREVIVNWRGTTRLLGEELPIQPESFQLRFRKNTGDVPISLHLEWLDIDASENFDYSDARWSFTKRFLSEFALAIPNSSLVGFPDMTPRRFERTIVPIGHVDLHLEPKLQIKILNTREPSQDYSRDEERDYDGEREDEKRYENHELDSSGCALTLLAPTPHVLASISRLSGLKLSAGFFREIFDSLTEHRDLIWNRVKEIATSSDSLSVESDATFSVNDEDEVSFRHTIRLTALKSPYGTAVFSFSAAQEDPLDGIVVSINWDTQEELVGELPWTKIKKAAHGYIADSPD